MLQWGRKATVQFFSTFAGGAVCLEFPPHAAMHFFSPPQWHSLSREEQSKYYEMARKERQIHMQLYPGWTARDNYAINSKKKKRKKDKSQDGDLNNPKKCRARFGLDQQSDWCKPCR